MSLLRWLQAKKIEPSTPGGARARMRKAFRETTLPLISPRRGRRILRREQLYSVVRESLIRAGVLSTSYEFKVLALDANGDAFLVLMDLALPAEAIPDEYLLEIERWVQTSARSRHSMLVEAVYWRRKATHDQRGMALKAAVVAQTRREAQSERPEDRATALPPVAHMPQHERTQPVARDEVEAFRKALASPAIPKPPSDAPVPGRAPGGEFPQELESDFAALSATQYGKLE
jgi:hypothetical protein